MDPCTLRELDRRECGGIEVALLWQANDNSVYVAVTDHRGHERFTQEVDPAAARDAFEHPYAYCACSNNGDQRRLRATRHVDQAA